jgi:2-oxo-4-hydroxy-4-carboxy-5-ureidoimidazoline decarboxylase
LASGTQVPGRERTEDHLMDTIALPKLNELPKAGFIAAVGDTFEHAQWVAETIEGRRPFASLNALFDAMAKAVRSIDTEKRLALVRGHPDLAGKAARAGILTAASTAEQASVGLDRLSDAEFAEFHRLNDAYKAKFGFPFIVCVRRHTRASILREFKRRLEHERDTELETALSEILRIGALRLDLKITADDRLKVHGRLSTHVLDNHSGRPAMGVRIQLMDGSGNLIVDGRTNADGRTDAPLIAGRPVPIGEYELRFAIGDYFTARKITLADPPFLNVVPVRFSVAEPEGHYHVPLLATPWSYTTYRGSLYPRVLRLAI